MSRKSFLQGAAILALAGVIVRIIGALYRIPLTNILGNEGVGLYQLAYPVYGLLLTLSTAGVPGAISKLVSERMVHHDGRGAIRIFRISLILLAMVGLVSAAAMALGSRQIALFIAGEEKGPAAEPSMLAAAPALFFVSVITAYRGYFQGLQQMVPTAVSQVWEQAVKIVPGFFIATQLNKISVEAGAAGAMWGVALSEVVALLYLIMTYSKRKKKMESSAGYALAGRDPQSPAEPFHAVAGRLARLALPMMAGAIFLPLASLADAAIVMNRLKSLGYQPDTALSLFGILSGMVNVLVNVPGVLSLSLSTSLIPAIAESRERNDMRSVERKSRVGLRMTMLVSMPSAVGLAVLARPIMRLLYGSSLTPEGLAVGAGLLVTSSISVIFLSVVQSTNGSLQGLGKVYVPMVSLAIGAALKIALNYTLVGIQSVRVFGKLIEVNIHGAPLGTIVCYLVPSIINLWYLTKATGIRLDWGGMLFRPGLASLGMGLAAWGVISALSGYISGNWVTVIAVLASIPIYAALAVAFGAIGRDELSYMPGGGTISAFLNRHKLLKG